MLEGFHIDEFTRDYIVRENKINKIILHTSNTDVCDFNIYAKKSLEIDNDAKRRAKDEAISIHIITAKLSTRLNILYERQICGFYGKPDFIIRLGKKLYIMVSTTRAICHNGTRNSKKNKKAETNCISIEFTQKEADRLMTKKLTGLSICKNNLECLVDDVIVEDHMVRPILHILCPNKKNAAMCIIAYKKILTNSTIDLSKIKIIISCVKNHKKLL
jgi:hypothetical protein